MPNSPLRRAGPRLRRFHLAHDVPDRLIGIHLNLMPVRRDPAMLENPTPAEARFVAELKHWMKEETGYQWIQGTRPQTLAAALTEIKQFGVQIAIDDFGTGYSSLSYLRQFPIDALKIDQSFVADMTRSKEAATVVRTLVRLANELGIETIAEGIEEPEQLSDLQNLNCAFGQGYWFAKPMRPEALDVFLDTWMNSRVTALQVSALKED